MITGTAVRSSLMRKLAVRVALVRGSAYTGEIDYQYQLSVAGWADYRRPRSRVRAVMMFWCEDPGAPRVSTAVN